MAKKLNSNLQSAKQAKQDEFYTQLADIENELRHYKKYFEGKTVLCNCDDPRVSNFFHYFSYGFEHLKLKRLISTCYKSQERDLFSQNDSEKAIWLEYTGDKNGNRVPDAEEIGINYFKGDGDFRSEECVELLKQADVVVTNPPFSLFREYVAQLIEYKKKFIIIGNKNAITYKEIFPLIRDNQLWVGAKPMGGSLWFTTPEGFANKTDKIIDGVKYTEVPCCWFTNLDHAKRNESLPLYKTYSPEDYPHYDNFDAIDVCKTADIPCDYDGIMGVPISFLDKYNPKQFEIVGMGTGDLAKEVGIAKNYRGRTDLSYTINGKTSCPFSRILIRRKK